MPTLWSAASFTSVTIDGAEAPPTVSSPWPPHAAIDAMSAMVPEAQAERTRFGSLELLDIEFFPTTGPSNLERAACLPVPIEPAGS
jgi:hypothetical protein